MKTADYLSDRERQDIRDAGRGHLIDGNDDYWRRVDEARERAKDEPREKEVDDQ